LTKLNTKIYKMSYTRLDAKDRKKQILDAALTVAVKDNYRDMTRNAIADVAECSPALVMYHYKTMSQLRRAVMRTAIQKENLVIIMQGLAANDPHAKRAPDHVKRAAMTAFAATV
jgi:AcrR family transcriptional regulator